MVYCIVICFGLLYCIVLYCVVAFLIFLINVAVLEIVFDLLGYLASLLLLIWGFALGYLRDLVLVVFVVKYFRNVLIMVGFFVAVFEKRHWKKVLYL